MKPHHSSFSNAAVLSDVRLDISGELTDKFSSDTSELEDTSFMKEQRGVYGGASGDEQGEPVKNKLAVSTCVHHVSLENNTSYRNFTYFFQEK